MTFLSYFRELGSSVGRDVSEQHSAVRQSEVCKKVEQRSGESCQRKIRSCNNKVQQTHSESIVYFKAQNDDNLWSERARRKVILAIISEWLKGNSKKTTVKKLLSALSGPGWLDVKLRVEKLMLLNVRTVS